MGYFRILGDFWCQYLLWDASPNVPFQKLRREPDTAEILESVFRRGWVAHGGSRDFLGFALEVNFHHFFIVRIYHDPKGSTIFYMVVDFLGFVQLAILYELYC